MVTLKINSHLKLHLRWHIFSNSTLHDYVQFHSPARTRLTSTLLKHKRPKKNSICFLNLNFPTLRIGTVLKQLSPYNRKKKKKNITVYVIWSDYWRVPNFALKILPKTSQTTTKINPRSDYQMHKNHKVKILDEIKVLEKKIDTIFKTLGFVKPHFSKASS